MQAEHAMSGGGHRLKHKAQDVEHRVKEDAEKKESVCCRTSDSLCC